MWTPGQPMHKRCTAVRNREVNSWLSSIVVILLYLTCLTGTQTPLRGFYLHAKLEFKQNVFIHKGVIPSPGTVVWTHVAIRGAHSGIHPWGRHTASGDGGCFQPFCCVLMILPFTSWLLFVFSHSSGISRLLPVVFTGHRDAAQPVPAV